MTQIGDPNDRIRFVEAEFATWHKRTAVLTGIPLVPGYRLAVYSVGSGLPDEHVLVLEGKRTQRLIFSLTALKGMVSIHSGDDALKFVRLRISSWADYCVAPWGSEYGESMMEVLTPKAFKKKASEFGSLRQPDYSILNDGFAGIVHSEPLQRLVANFPTVTGDASGYRVVRLMVVQRPERPITIERATEHVGFDGEYRVISETALTTGPLTQVHWFFPLRK